MERLNENRIIEYLVNKGIDITISKELK